MGVLYTEDEERFRQEVREFVRKEILPHAQTIERDRTYPKEILKKLGDKGYLGITYPREYGGTDRGLVYNTILSEEIAAASPVVDAARAVSVIMYGAPIFRFGTEEQKAQFLTPVVRGEKIGAIGITEPEAGSDAAGMESRAVREGDFYRINGQKQLITNGSVADYVLAFAITNPDVHAHQGMSAFIIETDNPGFTVAKDYESLGLHGGRDSHLVFKDLMLPASNLLGKENDGFNVLVDELASERVDIASRALGCARRVYEEAVKHSATRRQFGREIRRFEGVSFQIAEMKTSLDAARLLTLRAARMYDKGMRIEKEAAIAKLFTSEAAFKIADMSLQIHGGLGYTQDKVIEQFFRDVRVFRIGGGTSEIMKFLIQREEYRDFGF